MVEKYIHILKCQIYMSFSYWKILVLKYKLKCSPLVTVVPFQLLNSRMATTLDSESQKFVCKRKEGAVPVAEAERKKDLEESWK